MGRERVKHDSLSDEALSGGRRKEGEGTVTFPNALWPVRQSERVGKTRRVIDQRGDVFAVVNRWMLQRRKLDASCRFSNTKFSTS